MISISSVAFILDLYKSQISVCKQLNFIDASLTYAYCVRPKVFGSLDEQLRSLDPKFTYMSWHVLQLFRRVRDPIGSVPLELKKMLPGGRRNYSMPNTNYIREVGRKGRLLCTCSGTS